MNSCVQSHEITISSVKNSENSVCPLHLIKGSIKNVCRYTEIIISSDHEIQYSCSFGHSGKFKALVNLVNGQNHLKLSYCTAVTSLTLTYESPIKINYGVKVLYIVCDGHDGCFQSPSSDNGVVDACAKITVGLKIIQCLFGDKLLEQGFERKTFQLTSDCVPFYSRLAIDVAKRMDENSLWNYFAREIVSVENAENTKFIGFIGCTEFLGISDGNYTHENIQSKTVANAALGGGDFALFGSGCLYTWPKSISEIMTCFESTRSVDLDNYLDDSNSRKTWGGCFATTLGSVCHEIGHIFDLGHSPGGIMGNGFDFVNRVFTVSNQTLDLPNRITKKNMSNDKTPNDPRLTKLSSTNKFLDLFHNQKGKDLTFFERNSAITLAYHKWFNQTSDWSSGEIACASKGPAGLITSKNYPIRLIEFRDKENALTQAYYSFLDEIIFEFCITENVSANLCDIIVVDDVGNISKF